MLTGLAPLLGWQTRPLVLVLALVLGSFAGVASLRAPRHGRPLQHQLWRLVFASFQANSGNSPHVNCLNCYQIRTDWLLAQGVGLWDVYACCERQGSLDGAIARAELNALAALCQRCPTWRAIAPSAGESLQPARCTQALGLPVYRLSSSSPVKASWSFERKLAARRDVFQQYGLV